MSTQAASVRGIAKRYGLAREIVSAAIHRGELQATRIGVRRYLVLDEDFRGWLRSRPVTVARNPAARVSEVLEREARRA